MNHALRELDSIPPELSVCVVANTYDRAVHYARLSGHPNIIAVAPAMALTGRQFDVVVILDMSIVIFYHHWVGTSLLTRLGPKGKMVVLNAI